MMPKGPFHGTVPSLIRHEAQLKGTSHQIDSLDRLFLFYFAVIWTENFNELVSDPEFLVTRDSKVRHSTKINHIIFLTYDS